MDGVSHVSVSAKKSQFVEEIRADKSSRFGIRLLMLVNNIRELDKTGVFWKVKFAETVS